MSAVLEALADCAGPVIVLGAIYLLGKASEARKASKARSRRHHPARGGR